MHQQIIIYQSKDSNSPIDVQVADETVWLSLAQMETLFERDKSVISRHLRNIFREGELDADSVVANYATTAADGKSYNVRYYNLDAIISVGYRVNSKQGVRFRQWATQKLKDYLIQGYALNRQKLTQTRLNEIQQTLILLSNTLQHQNLVDDKGVDILSLILGYARTWSLLFQYDDGELTTPKGCVPAQSSLAYEEALTAIQDLKNQLFSHEEATPLFGQKRGDQLQGILGSIEQTFGERPLYQSREEKAAHLLYFVIKDHPFSDGNKRIGVLLFLLYLKKQRFPLDSLSNQTLVALALLIAESDPTAKEIMIKLIMNLLLS